MQGRKPLFFQPRLLITLLLMYSGQTLAVEWVTINGNVKFGDQSVCALVLANGQSMFSCSGDGSFELEVPLDPQGQITLFSYASGFAPYKQVLLPAEGIDMLVEMLKTSEGNQVEVTKTTLKSPDGRHATLLGTANSNGNPVCALILANGQKMFSCGDSHGKFDLVVPLAPGSGSEITLFVYASGFLPFKWTFSADTSPVNDTGIVACTDGSDNTLPCPVVNYPGQDAEYGLDVTNNNDADGHAGFSFTKLDNAGKPLPADAADWDCVKDNNTGLVWESKTTDLGLHDWSYQYTWYNTDSSENGGVAGFKGGQACTLDNCNTEEYAQAVNAESLCGFNDWTLPTRQQLFALVNFGQVRPAIDTNYFPNTQWGSHWTSTTNANNTFAFGVAFSTGSSITLHKSAAVFVRLVHQD